MKSRYVHWRHAFLHDPWPTFMLLLGHWVLRYYESALNRVVPKNSPHKFVDPRASFLTTWMMYDYISGISRVEKAWYFHQHALAVHEHLTKYELHGELPMELDKYTWWLKVTDNGRRGWWSVYKALPWEPSK